MTSTAIYTCYRQLHPPTGVDHAVFGSVTATRSRDLVVAKASILELYRVQRDYSPEEENATAAESAADKATPAAGSSGGGNNSGDIDDNDDSNFYLELAGTFPLAGNITALAVIPLAAATTTIATQQQDIVVVSFGAAKVALVAYDTLLGRLETLSIHNFDAGAIGPGAAGVESGYGLASALKDRPKTISSSEPSGRCLAAVVAGCQLVVLPVRRHVPRSVFVSEETGRRRRVLRMRRRAAAAVAAASRGSSGEAGAEVQDAGAVEGEDGADAARSSGNSGLSSGAAGGDSGSDDEDDYSVGARDSESETGEERGTGGTSSGSGGHAAVSKPFTIDLEEAGITG